MSVYGYCSNNPEVFDDPMGSDQAAMSRGGSLTLDGSDIGDAAYDPFGWAGNPDEWDGVNYGNGGGFGGGSSTGNYSYFDADGNAHFGGTSAQKIAAALEKAMKNPDADGNWSLDIGTNKNGEVGYWGWVDYPTNPEWGKTLAGVSTGLKFFALGDGDGNNPPPSSNSFHFVTYISADFKDLKYSGGWQIAAIRGLYYQYKGSASPDVYIKLPLLYFGLPVLRKDGTNYTYEIAQNIAKQAVSFAEFASGEAYADGDYSPSSLENIYLEALKTAMGASAGTATTYPGINIIINPKDITVADYSYMDTW